MPTLLVVGGGLFGSQAAAYARSRSIEARVFDAGLPGAASPAAAGLFKEAWAGNKYRDHFRTALPILDRLFGIRQVSLSDALGHQEAFHFVSPSAILEAAPERQRVRAVGDGWLETDGERHEGWVYIAAGVWCPQLQPGLEVIARAGASFLFPGERPGRVQQIEHGKQALSFVRDPGTTFFSDGTAEQNYQPKHDRQSLERARALGLEIPRVRIWGQRPYTSGGPRFLKLGSRTWLATGGRKMGTILGAAFAKRLIDQELS